MDAVRYQWIVSAASRRIHIIGHYFHWVVSLNQVNSRLMWGITCVYDECYLTYIYLYCVPHGREMYSCRWTVNTCNQLNVNLTSVATHGIASSGFVVKPHITSSKLTWWTACYIAESFLPRRVPLMQPLLYIIRSYAWLWTSWKYRHVCSKQLERGRNGLYFICWCVS